MATDCKYNIVKSATGTTIYQGFDFPEDISNLDMETLKKTLDFHIFLAHMSDDYNVTKSEIASIAKYANEHNIPNKYWLR